MSEYWENALSGGVDGQEQRQLPPPMGDLAVLEVALESGLTPREVIRLGFIKWLVQAGHMGS